MNPTRPSASAVVIGGGVIGLFTAWRLCDAGFAVTVLERGEAGRSASWAGGGILSPLPPWQAPAAVWPLAAESIREYPALTRSLYEATGIDPQYTPSGMWVLNPQDHAAAEAWAGQGGLPLQWSHWQGAAGLHLPWVAQVRSPRLLRALLAYLRQRGVRLVEQAAVTGFEQRDGALCSVSTADGVRHVADAYVICAGAWTGVLSAQLGPALPVAPVRGQMILLQGPACLPDAPWPPIVLAGERYLIPRRDGGIVVGSTLESVGFDEGRTAEAQASLLAFAHQALPATQALPVIHHWSGLRPAAPDGVPLIQPVAGCRRAYVNAGHFRNGITLAPASARRLLSLLA